MTTTSCDQIYLLLCKPLHMFVRHADPARLDVSCRVYINGLPLV